MTDQQPRNPNSGKYSEYFEKDITSFMDIILVISHHLKIILIIPTILCTLTIIYLLFIANPIYESRSKIMSSAFDSDSQIFGMAAQFGITMPASQSNPKWVYSEIIKSRTLARAMLKQKFDTEKYGPQKTLLQILTYEVDDPEFSMDKMEIIAVDAFIGMIELLENVKTGIYTIILSAPEPQLASDLNIALIKELDNHQKQFNQTQTSKTRQFIEERIIDAENELRVVEETLKDFTVHNRRIENSPLLLLEQKRIEREVSVHLAVFSTLKQQLEKTKIEQVKESDYVLILDPPEVPLYRSKPQRKKMVFLMGILGIGCGVGIALLREYLHNIKDEEKEKMSNAKSILLKNLLDMVPKIAKKKK